MNSSTWSRSVRLAGRLGPGGRAEVEARGTSEDDLQLERWHESNLGNIAYLVIFAAVAVVTLLAFVPVWIVLQAQRAADSLSTLCRRFRQGSSSRG